ncbi:tetratricopeptide repeat protein [Heyndrickxia acidicola]|uniref:Tetratricopeptide repeat protein n=1 Tax=Heyndrickxia acidicola TaxID=209389 RepID=A0ABU6MN06_9BACI|nr:tetratricopeptide repeat protein [Heyndrickxia acidicola]MED1205003.1 tetratricopeptide repeat protein [Heyndrickxia acidicola]
MEQLERVIEHLESGNLTEAEKEYKKIKTYGSDEEKYMLAEELVRLGFMPEARELYELLLESYPDEGEILIALAEIYIDMDKEEESILLLDSIAETDPEYPRALLLLADLYQMQGLFEVSEKKLLEAKELMPEEPVIDFALGELYASIARYYEAAKCYEAVKQAKEEEIQGVNINSRLAEVYSAAGSFEEALAYYEQAIEDQVEINTLFGYALTAYQAGFYAKAIQLFNQLKELDPDYHSLYLYLGKAYEQEENLDHALSAVKEGIKLDDFNKELYQFGGKLALKAGDEEQAEEYFRTALTLDPGYLDAALALNKLLLHQERYEDVQEIIQLMEQEGDLDPELHWDCAVANQKSENYSNALKHYELAYNDLKNNQEFMSDYGYFLIEEGDRKKAAQIFGKLLQEQPANEEWSLILERLND